MCTILLVIYRAKVQLDNLSLLVLISKFEVIFSLSFYGFSDFLKSFSFF